MSIVLLSLSIIPFTFFIIHLEHFLNLNALAQQLYQQTAPSNFLFIAQRYHYPRLMFFLNSKPYLNVFLIKSLLILFGDFNIKIDNINDFNTGHCHNI